MTTTAPSADRLRESIAPFMSFFSGPFAELNLEPDVANFAVGNPQEPPIPAYVDALHRNIAPQNKDWFAYKLSEPASQRTVAGHLSRLTGLEWDPDDVAMTNGGFAALAVTLRTPAGRLRAVIARHEAEPRPLSCGDEPEAVPAFELTGLDALDRAA